MKNRIITGLLALAFLAGAKISVQARPAGAAQDIQPVTETPAQHDARMSWWRDARFGMFIHWGVYSVPAGEWNGETGYAEWIMENAHIPVSRYEQFAKEFDPVKFDAHAWVKTAKDAGMKYIVITSKHHDGFCMWPTKLTDWSICRTPWWQRTHRDPLKELSDECRKQGIKFGVYYSIMDWHSSDWGTRRAWNDVATGTPDMDRYVAYMKGQLKELITRYHPAVLWFDGEWESPWTHARGVDLFNYLRALDPSLIINNRIDKNDPGVNHKQANLVGDYGTPEQRIPPNGFGPGVDWETCMTMNHHWGYNKHDTNWKSPETIIRNLCDIASKGGNYLLNVGPTSQGVIPPACVERLEKVGQWMRVNGAAIYGSGPTPFGAEAGSFSAAKKDKQGRPEFIPAWNWRATTKPGKIYLEIFNWPKNGKFLAPGLESRVTRATLLGSQLPLGVSQTAAGATIYVPEPAPNPIASVVCLDIKDQTPEVASPHPAGQTP